MIKINLVSEGRKPIVARKAKEALGVGQTSLGDALLIASIVVGILVCTLIWWGHKTDLADRTAAVAEAQREVDELAAVLKEVEDFKTKKAELEHKIEVINTLKQNQWGPVRIMDEVSIALPDLLWLNSMTLRGHNVQLKGKAFNTNQVATFIENLKAVPEFREPQPPIDLTRSGEFYNFSFSFDFSFAEPEEGEDSDTPAGG